MNIETDGTDGRYAGVIGYILPPPPFFKSYNMGHNGHGINMYGVLMILLHNFHAMGHFDRGLSVLVQHKGETPLSIKYAYCAHVRMTISIFIAG